MTHPSITIFIPLGSFLQFKLIPSYRVLIYTIATYPIKKPHPHSQPSPGKNQPLKYYFLIWASAKSQKCEGMMGKKPK
jgi:hypothetical protein